MGGYTSTEGHAVGYARRLIALPIILVASLFVGLMPAGAQVPPEVGEEDFFFVLSGFGDDLVPNDVYVAVWDLDDERFSDINNRKCKLWLEVVNDKSVHQGVDVGVFLNETLLGSARDVEDEPEKFSHAYLGVQKMAGDLVVAVYTGPEGAISHNSFVVGASCNPPVTTSTTVKPTTTTVKPTTTTVKPTTTTTEPTTTTVEETTTTTEPTTTTVEETTTTVEETTTTTEPTTTTTEPDGGVGVLPEVGPTNPVPGNPNYTG